MKNTWLISCLLTFCFGSLLWSQDSGDKTYLFRYSQSQVLDSTEGILIYKKMVKVMDTDHALLSKDGYAVQGWNEQYYDNGMLQHISYYRDNKLVLFKNFFENGQCEHNVTFTDSLNCNIEVYFDNGNIKNHISFYSGSPKKMTEFYPNGLPKCNIEFDLNQNCITLKRTWFLNAEEQSEIISTDVKNKFIERLYYPNGQLKEEGELIYSEDKREYYKNGTWNTYESSGKKKHSEKFKFN